MVVAATLPFVAEITVMQEVVAQVPAVTTPVDTLMLATFVSLEAQIKPLAMFTFGPELELYVPTATSWSVLGAPLLSVAFSVGVLGIILSAVSVGSGAGGVGLKVNCAVPIIPVLGSFAVMTAMHIAVQGADNDGVATPAESTVRPGLLELHDNPVKGAVVGARL